MAYPTIASANGHASTSLGDTEHDIPMPATVAAGRLLIVAIASTTPVIPPGDWTLIKTKKIHNIRGSIFAKITTGTEGGTSPEFETTKLDYISAHIYYISDANMVLANNLMVAEPSFNAILNE